MTQSSNSDASAQGLDYWCAQNLPDLSLIRERLPAVFPEGLDARGWAVAERAAKSLFVFLYVLAIDGISDRRVRPAMVRAR